MINHILYYTSATKGKLNGEHEYSTEEANLLFKLARLKIKIVQKNTILSPCPLITCIIKTRILDIIWPCLLIIMIMTWLFSGILFIWAANDTTRAQINNIPEKSHVISLLCMDKKHWAVSVFWKLFVRKWGGYLTFTALRIQNFTIPTSIWLQMYLH